MAATTDSATATPTENLQPAREVDLERAVRVGLLGGLAAVFVAASGMLQTFDVRSIVHPILALSYVALYIVPFGIGYIAGQAPQVLEGFAAPVPGKRNVQAGLIAGALTGVVTSLFVAFVQVFDVSSIFIKITPTMSDLLTLGLDTAAGIPLIVTIMAVVGAFGGVLHVLSRKWRRAVLYSSFWVIMLGLLQVIVGQVDFMRRSPLLTDFFYSSQGGMTLGGAAIVFGVVFAGFWFLDSRVRALRNRVTAMTTEASQKKRAGVTLAVLIVAAPILVLLPRALGPFVSEVLDLAGVFLLMALGLNIVVGFAGLLDLGYVAFFAVGAYTTSVLTSPVSPQWSPELSFWMAIPFIVLAAAVAGILVGTPVLRMRGDYLAIVTLGFGEIARILFLSDALKPYFGGAQGMLLVPDIPFLFTIKDSVTFFPIIYAFVILFAYLSYALQDSRLGRAWMAMREDEPVAEVMGVNIVAAKLWAFVIGAIFAGLGGALFAHKIGSVFPESFEIIVSITVLVLIIVGGMASIPGVIVGALVLVGLPELLREFQEFKFLFYGILLIFMMLKRPEGFIPSRRRARELHEEEVLQDAWLESQSGRAEPDAAGAS